MFAKPFRVKSNTQMKGSDRKKFRAEVRKKFSSAFPTPENGSLDPLDEVVSSKDEITSSKVYTFSGESFVVYYQCKNPIFIEPEKERGNLIPTVYTLWLRPELLPSLTTHPPVVEKLQNGADLMLPGIVVKHSLGIKAYLGGKIRKGDLLSVNTTSNKAPIAVGIAALSSEDMYMSGNRGKGLTMFHCIGDQLWASGMKTSPPELGTPYLPDLNSETSSEEESSEEEAVQNISADVEVEELSEAFEDLGPQDENLPTCEIDEGEFFSNNGASEVQTVIEEPNNIPLTPEDWDIVLENALLQASKTSAKKVEFPILSSNFYRTHILTALPPGMSFDVKKTSYKKLSKFLEKMASDGLIGVNEPKKGIEMISHVNYDHPKVIHYRVQKYEEIQGISSSKEGKEFTPPVILELKVISGESSKFFKACGVPKGGLSATEARAHVKNYIDSRRLQCEDNPKMVKLSDPLLADVVLVKGEEGKVMSMPWENVYSRVISKMSNGYSITFEGCQPTVHKGKLELIEMSVGNRSGNKKVTLIHNLDIFGIDLNEFAHKCQVGVAASTSIHDMPFKKRAGGAPVKEVLIQGNQVAFAGRLLTETYKIPKKYIRGLELAIKQKKGK